MGNRCVVVGGCGHVGLPLALSLADAGWRAVAYDTSVRAVQEVSSGVMPFLEEHAESVLRRTLDSGVFGALEDPAVIADAKVVIMVIGTPVDDHMNPDPNAVVQAIGECLPHMSDEQLLMLKPTVLPGVTRRIEDLLRTAGLDTRVAFCPERIVEGREMTELRTRPQIISAWDPETGRIAREVFESLGVSTIEVLPEEAELAKLFTNAWRSIKFAATNQFRLMANDWSLDFARIREAITFEYPRARDMPGPGFAASPACSRTLRSWWHSATTTSHLAIRR